MLEDNQTFFVESCRGLKLTEFEVMRDFHPLAGHNPFLTFLMGILMTMIE